MTGGSYGADRPGASAARAGAPGHRLRRDDDLAVAASRSEGLERRGKVVEGVALVDDGLDGTRAVELEERAEGLVDTGRLVHRVCPPVEAHQRDVLQQHAV